MLQPSTMRFLKQLRKHNDRIWFHENRAAYEAARSDFATLVTELIAKLGKTDPGLRGLQAKDTLFRINRDTRFSKDKSPYKVNFGASISAGGKKISLPGYYLHIEPGNRSFSAGGFYMPGPEALAAIRQEIDYNLAAFEKVLKSASFRKYFSGLDEVDVMKTAPKGYKADNPAIGYLRHRSLIVSHAWQDAEIGSPEFLNELAASMKAMIPFIRFLRAALE